MKTLVTLCLILFVSALSAADVIVLNDDGTVTKNGTNLNNVWDALLNKQLTNKECADAWKAKMKEVSDKQADLDKAKAEASTKAAFALEKLKAKKAKEEAGGKGKKWEALDELETEINVTADDIKEAEIDAQIEALKKQKKKK